MKPKRRYKPVEIERFHGWIADKGCLVCGFEATVHHVTGYADRPGRFSRSEWLVVPLCWQHHQIQGDPKRSVEALGHQGFFQEWGVDLHAEAMKLAEEWRRP